MPGYSKLLTLGNLSQETILSIHTLIRNLNFAVNPIEPELLNKGEFGEKITEKLARLNLALIEGNSSWEGLFVGFPGNKEQLSTESIGTPYLRSILYPILDLHHRLQTKTKKRLPCIYFVGERFSDVFLRKFDLLKEVVPNIIVCTNDLYECAENKSKLPATEKGEHLEAWTQMKLCHVMNSKEGLRIPLVKENSIIVKYLAKEVPCSEGTENPERLDILGYDETDHSLVAFELKGAVASRVELENLFLQGMEHRNWLEKNKMAIKLMFDRGQMGNKINTRKRVRLLIGFYSYNVPHIFDELRNESKRRDSHLQIDYVRLSNINGEVMIDIFS